MQILFIGNSYTYYNDMPSLFARLANQNGKAVTVQSVTCGGRKLESYTDASDAVTAALDALLAQQRFDICFIQEQSVLPASDREAFMRGLDCVMNKLNGRADRVVLYATWGRKEGSPDLYRLQWTTEEMAHLLSDGYQKAAQHYGAQVSPVGMNFLRITQTAPALELYDADMTHPSYEGSCLAALTHYRAVFGEFPAHTETLGLDPAYLSAFRTVV